MDADQWSWFAICALMVAKPDGDVFLAVSQPMETEHGVKGHAVQSS